MTFGSSAMIGRLLVNLPHGSSQAASSCALEEWLLKERVGYFDLNPFKVKLKLQASQNISILALTFI